MILTPTRRARLARHIDGPLAGALFLTVAAPLAAALLAVVLIATEKMP